MNWSLTLNVLLLLGVMVAIVRTLRSRRQGIDSKTEGYPTINQVQTNHFDDIIAVRKVNEEPIIVQPALSAQVATSSLTQGAEYLTLVPKINASGLDVASSVQTSPIESQISWDNQSTPPLMMFLLAKSNRQLAGYELLQAVLSAGFRFGEGDLFHRHQYPNGQGTIMCSLAAATPTGVFDLQHIGGFVVRGLCLFMHASGNTTVDAERFDIMMDTAKTLSDSLDAHLLDEQKQPLSELSIAQYYQRLSLPEEDTVVCV